MTHPVLAFLPELAFAHEPTTRGFRPGFLKASQWKDAQVRAKRNDAKVRMVRGLSHVSESRSAEHATF